MIPRWLIACLVLAAIAAVFLRAPELDRRPMHNDEAVNAIKFGQLWQGHGYKYDPNEHHGPTLYYATFVLGKLTGGPDFDRFSQARLLWVPVLFGIALLALLPLTVDGLDRRATAWAALFIAVSPAMVFYSRYYIHEMLLVFATSLTLGAGWHYWRTRFLPWAILAGIGLGLMQATKETFVITLGAAGLALFLNHAWNRALDASGAPVHAPRLNWKHLAAGLAAWIFVAVLFFTSFFTNASGLLDSIRTYLPWLERAGGESPHIHPWTFFLERLLYYHPAKGPAWSEGLIFVLALIGAWAGFARKKLGHASASFVRFLAFHSLLLTAFYSLLPYKTPWCLLNFWYPMILLGGVGVAVMVRDLKPLATRIAVSALVLAGAGHLAWQAWQATHEFAEDRRNPYVYAQTSDDLLRLVKRIEALAQAGPAGQETLIKVVAPEDDYWPLPWYLRSFDKIGWWNALPEDPFAPIMIVSSSLDARLDEKKTHLMTGYYQLRPEVFLELYVELDLWREFLAKNPPPTSAD